LQIYFFPKKLGRILIATQTEILLAAISNEAGLFASISLKNGRISTAIPYANKV
jgi:hypothetical protein